MKVGKTVGVRLGRVAVALVAVTIAGTVQAPQGVPALASTPDQTGQEQQVPRGPARENFYYPPPSLVDGPHGSVIWARPLTGTAALPGSDNWLVLYRSRTPQGKAVAVSGTIAVPQGKAPDGGWPVMTWTHGTTGVADMCAPSRDSENHPSHDYVGLMNETLAKWVERGYAVTKTDYQGLGTDGAHGYLMGIAEARAAADITLAAQQLSSDLSSRWVVNGHSQGGQAAFFTGADGQSWAPELDLRGAVALAPPSQTRDLLFAARNAPFEGAAFSPLIIRGVETATDLKTEEILTPKAWNMLPHADDRCIAQLREPNSWGGMKTNEVFKAGADMSDFDQVVDENDPAHLSPEVPILLAHGGQDEVVPHALSHALYVQQKAKGTEIEYRFYPPENHRGVVAASYQDVSAWVDAQVGWN